MYLWENRIFPPAALLRLTKSKIRLFLLSIVEWQLKSLPKMIGYTVFFFLKKCAANFFKKGQYFLPLLFIHYPRRAKIFTPG